jgi:hypothetical protein
MWCGCGSTNRHAIVEPEFVDECVGPHRLDVALGSAGSADDDEAGTRVAERGKRPDRHVGALERLDAPDEQQQRSVDVEAERTAGPRLVAGREERVLDAWSDDLEAALRFAVVEAELIGLLLAAHADRVGAVDDLGLGTVTPHRFGITVGGLHPGEGVEGGHERNVELVLERVADDAAQPVVGVDHVGAFVPSQPVEHAVAELVGDLRERFLGEVVRPCRDVDHAVAGFDEDLVGKAVSVGAGERGGLDTRLRQGRAEFADVHVHPAAVACARLQQR